MKLLYAFFIAIGLNIGFVNQVWAFKAPTMSGPVVDEVGLLSNSASSQISQVLFGLQKNNGSQVQVYITSSLQNEDIASVAIQIFDQWKIGDAKKDNGILFLIAPNEKKMRLEIGQGLEGDIPDVIAKRIIEDVVSPFFKRGEYDVGVSQGIAALQTYMNATPEQKAQLQEKINNTKSEFHKESATKKYGFFLILGIWLLLFMFNPSLALGLLFALSRGGGARSGGSWGGGGGRSSGGGASGGW